ncbi:MAG TPA: PaaI family thioesterase [Desulfobacteraceae bacterium]|jgi:uncharacterized protein (TIGR00369 family)|nr:PaaI family thioesterase [Desulfobacteraceae bacterium]
MTKFRKLNPAHVEEITRRACTSPYFRLISLRVTEILWGSSRVDLTVEEKHLQPWGRVHGAVYAALVDVAAFWAVYTQIPEGVGLTTAELKLNYLAPVSSGELIGRGKSIKVGKTLSLGEASVYDETNRLLAHGTATLIALDSLSLKGKTPLPPKWI